MPIGASSPCCSHTKVSAALTSYPPRPGRSSHRVRYTPQKMKPNTVLVNVPDAVAIRYVE
jgi:hypothetical protein